MKYFRIYNSSEVEEVGSVPQSHDAIVNFDIYGEMSGYHLHFQEALNETLWPIPKLSSRAKKTDLISVSFMSLSNKLLVSQKLYSVLIDGKIDGLQFIKSKLLFKRHEEDYWIINPYKNCISVLDLEKSEFAYLKSIGSLEKEEIHFKTLNDLREAFDKNKFNPKEHNLSTHRPLIIDKIAIRNNLSNDFFALSPLNYGGIGYFVSERFKDEIEKKDCTGIVFTDLNERYPK